MVSPLIWAYRKSTHNATQPRKPYRGVLHFCSYMLSTSTGITYGSIHYENCRQRPHWRHTRSGVGCKPERFKALHTGYQKVSNGHSWNAVQEITMSSKTAVNELHPGLIKFTSLILAISLTKILGERLTAIYRKCAIRTHVFTSWST